MELLELPVEVLEQILSLLVPKDVISASQTCKFMYELCESDKIWSNACFNQCKIQLPAIDGFPKKFYRKVICSCYGNFIGLWKTHADCYGGLLQIKYSDSKIIGVDLQLPKDPYIKQSLRPKTIFEIELNQQTGCLQMTCSKNPAKRHCCSLTYGEKAITPSGPRSLYLTRQCAEDADSSDHYESDDFQVQLEMWLDEQSDFIGELAPFTRGQLIYKYMVLRQVDLKTHYSRFEMPSPCNFHVPIQPGLFKGTYSAHGLELVSLSYEEDRNRVSVVKITGDPNVPAGQVTFRADLPFCMHLSEAQQATFDSIREIEARSSDFSWYELPSPQPFVVPQDCIERYSDIPKECIARFHGFGQIAAEGFQNSEFVEGHWIVFNEDLFGFLWISLEALSMYHRVKESLTI